MNPIELPAAGFHYGVPYETYAKWPAANFSKIKPIRETASKCKWEIDHPKKATDAMKLGSALHMATLEPARFEDSIYIAPYYKASTTEGAAMRDKCKAEAGDRIYIRSGSSDDDEKKNMGAVEALRGMAKAIHSMKSAAPFLTGQGQNEVCAVWKDEETGIWCKARLDRFVTNYKSKKGLADVVVEVKTARSAAKRAWTREVDKRDYDAQGSSYTHGVKTITGNPTFHVFIVAESAPPYDAAVMVMGDKTMQTGLLKYRQMLTRYAECMKSGQWPGYEDKVTVFETEDYVHQRDYDN